MCSCDWRMISYLNHPVGSPRGEALFPQNRDAGVEPAGVVGDRDFPLLGAEAHLWNIVIINN